MTASAEEFEIENPVEETPETVIHFAKCQECGGTVRYQLTSSGHGLIEIERNGFDAEKSFGLSSDGLPECPNGHGIMPLADEQIWFSPHCLPVFHARPVSLFGQEGEAIT